jgi:hypothetical protein
MRGYLVDANQAVDCLEAHAPDAAAWWRAHARELLQSGSGFIFDVDACEIDS